MAVQICVVDNQQDKKYECIHCNLEVSETSCSSREDSLVDPSGEVVPLSLLRCKHCSKDLAVKQPGSSWFSINESLVSPDAHKEGFHKVITREDYVALYVLSQIFYNQYERLDTDVPFCCPGPADVATVLWQRGLAVGFYSVKPQGTVYADGTSAVYQLPVVDLVYVKASSRHCGHATSMLTQAVIRYPEQDIGFSCPLSPGMWSVLHKYLVIQKDSRKYFWATTFTGGEGHRINIWLHLLQMKRKETNKLN